ncbi:hypothetical protein R3W88_026906 [Solanum pinnatisectum]|uniref:Uncharacterized protein n=1 Tax=Solanum pinnatisectum TaxID=50273 RepID=A0AAV9LFR0_9SOLN|nr:hypothetical protein R3W88_026906 [Solanum pinnatisectum]
MKHQSDLKVVHVVNFIVNEQSEVPIKERLGVEALAVVIVNFDGEKIEEYDELVVVLDGVECSRCIPKKMDLDLKN